MQNCKLICINSVGHRSVSAGLALVNGH